MSIIQKNTISHTLKRFIVITLLILPLHSHTSILEDCRNIFKRARASQDYVEIRILFGTRKAILSYNAEISSSPKDMILFRESYEKIKRTKAFRDIFKETLRKFYKSTGNKAFLSKTPPSIEALEAIFNKEKASQLKGEDFAIRIFPEEDFEQFLFWD